MNEPKNILIVRTDRIGDVVLTLPIVSIIKKHFREAKVSFLLREYTKPLAENNPNIDEIIILIEKDNKAKIWKNVFQLRNKFDTVIVAYPTFIIALILFIARIKTRIGSGYRWYSFLFNKKIFEHRKTAQRHELEYNIKLLSALGINDEVKPSTVSFYLSPTQSSIGSIKKKFVELKIDNSKKLIIVHPGSGGSSVDLPIESFKQLIRKITDELDVEILITGAASEKELCQSLVVNQKTKNGAGLFNLSELIATINKSSLLIANSTGPIHIAAALDKYVIGFYPKIVVCSEERWGPYTTKKRIFKPEIDCSNCSTEQCSKLNCMGTININSVFDAVKNFLHT